MTSQVLNLIPVHPPARCPLRLRPMRRSLSSSLLRYALSSLLLSTAPAIATAHQDNQPVIRFVRNPDPAPEFKLTSLDGTPLTLDAVRGRVVLLNFWATWCGPCRAEIPDLIDLQKRYKDRLQIIGLDVDDDDVAEVQKYVDENGINYPVAMTPGELRMQYGGIPALPTSFVLDTEGRVVQKHVGLWDPALYETEIRALLGMPIMARVETFDDTGQVFLKHADRATELPGVNLSKLTPDQKKGALRRFNAENCTCGCKFTLAQCRVWDSGCSVSKAAIEKILAEISAPPAALPGDAPQPPQNPVLPNSPTKTPPSPSAPKSQPNPVPDKPMEPDFS